MSGEVIDSFTEGKRQASVLADFRDSLLDEGFSERETWWFLRQFWLAALFEEAP